uniref:HECT domain-containing protein n=1 Tax=Cyprinus carpio carpio TaxID=630221 RepID=A0A9J8B852_CYPCA
MTPSSAEELQHMQAGLGKRHLSMTDDLTHSEVSSLFCDTYPKMKSASGGCLLYKASGGQGRRRLNLVPPESEGYSGSTIRCATGGGKTMLYIVPLQDEFDLSPLPSDAQEFSLMPKAECKKCFKMMPLQILALHVRECDTLEYETLSDSEPEVTNSPPAFEEKSTDAKCPVCMKTFPLLELEFHASFCGDLESSPVNTLKITFLGEAGVDTGALRKEFLTELIGGIETRLFEGEEGKGKMPKYSLNDLDNGLFRVAGEVFAVSLAQGGPAPRFLQDWCYDFLLSGTLENANKDNVYDAEFSPLIKMIEETSDLSSYSEQIVNRGFTGPINEDNKQNITRAIVMHAAARRTLMLQQLREGLQLYRLIDTMEKNREVCRSLFVVQGGNDKVDSHYIVSHLAPQMSESGTLKHTKEVQILNHFQDFLMELEDGDAKDEAALSVPQVMQWLTGQAHRHLLLSEREAFKITVQFDHTSMQRLPSHTLCYPIISACTQTITFPTAHLSNSNEFKEIMKTAVQHGGCFYRV